MPSATRAESLSGIPEVIDGTHSLAHAPNTALSGFAMSARTSARPSFPPLGPPDMLYIRKRYTSVVGGPKTYGYYHFVRGADVSHAAAISAYIVDVVRNSGLDPLSWVSAGGWEIASATFVAYNLMSKADAIVHVDFPGSTSVVATGPDGRDVEISDVFWSELLVSSVVRDILRVGEVPLYPCLRVVSAKTASGLEPRFLDAATDCAHRWHLSGIDTISSATDFAAKSRVASTIRDYFIDNARFETAIEFFTRDKVLAADPDCAVHAAAAARKMGALDRATSIIDALLEKAPTSELGWTERAEILRGKGEIEKAMEAAKNASDHAIDSVAVWVLLADLYVDLKMYNKALEALNAADMPPPVLDPFLRKLVPNRKNTTTPLDGSAKGTDTIRVLATRLREEKNMSSDKTDNTLTELPGKLMTDAEQDCYKVLVKILNDLTWDDMLAIRGECFVMETDVEEQLGDGANGEGEDADQVDLLASGEVSGDPGGNGAPDEDGQLSNIDLADGATEDVTNDLATLSVGSENNNTTEDQNGTAGDDDDDGQAASEQRLRSLEQLGKTVCKPWLDYLVTNMYQDLRAMAVWTAEEQQHSAGAALVAALQAKKARGESSDGGGSSPLEREDLESQELEDYRRSPDEVAKTSKRPPADWLRRGELATRLGKREEAKTAYWTCVKLSAKEKTVAVTALSRLMKISAEDGDTKTTLRCADAVWSYLDSSTDRKESSEPTPPIPDVRSCVFRLISSNGLRAVRDVVSNEADLDRKRMEGLLLDAVALKVDGFSR